ADRLLCRSADPQIYEALVRGSISIGFPGQHLRQLGTRVENCSPIRDFPPWRFSIGPDFPLTGAIARFVN
ncbi:MAG: hypothetical protein ACPGLY_20875, partial [Rubripirellula sp.]